MICTVRNSCVDGLRSQSLASDGDGIIPSVVNQGVESNGNMDYLMDVLSRQGTWVWSLIAYISGSYLCSGGRRLTDVQDDIGVKKKKKDRLPRWELKVSFVHRERERERESCVCVCVCVCGF